MHPHRHEFPDDYVRFFRQEIRSHFFEPGVWFLVTTAVVGEEDEVAVGLRGNEEYIGVSKRPKEEDVKVSVREKKEAEEETGIKGDKSEPKKKGGKVIVVGAAKWKRQGKGRRRYSSWMNGMYNMCFFTSILT